MNYSHVIEYKKANIHHRNGIILTDVDFTLAFSEFVYIKGPTGSGKSSFLKTLYGENKVGAELAKVLEFDLLKLSSKMLPELRRNIGMVFQDFKLFSEMTAFENLDFVLKATDWKDDSKRKDRVEEVLDLLQINYLKEEKVHGCSGGEKRKIAIARALLNRPRLLIADEPTANLDKESTKTIMNILTSLSINEKTAVVLCTHDQYIIDRYPAREFVIDNMRMYEEG